MVVTAFDKYIRINAATVDVICIRWGKKMIKKKTRWQQQEQGQHKKKITNEKLNQIERNKIKMHLIRINEKKNKYFYSIIKIIIRLEKMKKKIDEMNST